MSGTPRNPCWSRSTMTAGATIRTQTATRWQISTPALAARSCVTTLKRSTVAAEVEPFKDCKCSIGEQTRVLLLASLAQVGPLYALEKQGGFERSDPRGIAFATKRLAAGAQATRDMIVNAWLGSANTPVGYPMVNVRDIESGEVRATPELFRAD
jgi:hypothetical protein